MPESGSVIRRAKRPGSAPASNVMNTVFLAAVFLSAIIFLAAPWIVANVVAPGFASPYIDLSHPASPGVILDAFHPDRVMQTANLMRVLLLSLMIFSVSGLCTGILQTHQRFLLPALVRMSTGDALPALLRS